MRAYAIAAVLAIALLAGCSGKSSSGDDDGKPPVDVTEDTGAVRGVVIDESVRPLRGATVTVQDQSHTTDDTGEFLFTGLLPGPAVVAVTHPLYAPAERAYVVEAGDTDPEFLRFTMRRVVADEPYIQTLTFEGYMVCSASTAAADSEECGEGVGVPCDVPAVGCQRVGGQDDNRVQFDFFVDGVSPQTILVEQYWDPASPEAERFHTFLATNWTCDPSCGGNELAEVTMGSPLTIRYDIEDNMAKGEPITPELQFSTFTWASSDVAGVTVSQKFDVYVTVAYVLPLPEGWKLGDPDPF